MSLYVKGGCKAFAGVCVDRAIGQDRGGHGPDQRGHARGGEESLRHGEVLRYLCAAVQQVSIERERSTRHTLRKSKGWQNGRLQHSTKKISNIFMKNTDYKYGRDFCKHSF